jgi:hypothetical protein
MKTGREATKPPVRLMTARNMRAAALGAAMLLGAGGAVAACARSGIPLPVTDACMPFGAQAELAELHVFILMDASGSMDFTTPAGVPKWLAAREALASFFADPESEGVGASVTFFPVIDQGVPEYCSDHATCGEPGACDFVKWCVPSSSGDCKTDADCEAGDSCKQIGFCENAPDQFCLPGEVACGVGQGDCLNLGYCKNRYSCEVDDYATPIVSPGGTLPEVSSKILGALDARRPEGATPTLPALEGAVAQAVAWSAAHPTHKVIVLLATDGLPTACDPALESSDPSIGIAHIAGEAADGAASGVETFVIGVFAPDEQAEAQDNLDEIAAAGGTSSAIVVTAATVSEELLSALKQVRITAKACEFAIPPTDEEVDFTRVRVRITPPGGAPRFVERRGSEAECDPATGGFFYDKPANGKTTPGRIILCAASCALLGSASDRSIEIFTLCDNAGDTIYIP